MLCGQPPSCLFMFSHAKEVAAHFERHRWWVRALIVIYVVLSAAYLLWRLTVFNPDALWMSVLFYGAEIYGFLIALTMLYCAWDYRVREIPAEIRKFTVDVLVPVYTEPAEMIELTLIGAKEIDYPHETYLLDDGKRDELRAIAEKHGAHYIRREGNKGAKAGNLNHALAFGRGELIAVFDADHIAQREALSKLAPFMQDDSVGMVQAPQAFYNEDCFLYRDVYAGAGRWHEQAFFMDRVQSRHDMYDACTGIGTGVVYRRAAIEKLGGFPEATITEDIHTSLLMHKHGMKSVYLNEPVAWGVAAADVSEFNKTRRRWAHGNLQALIVENALFCRGLPWRKRLAYISMGMHMLEGWQQFIMLVLPLISMVFLVMPFAPTVTNALAIVLVPVIQVVMMVVLGAGYLRFLGTQVFVAGKMLLQMSATPALLGKKLGWQVSLKNVLGKISVGLLAPHVFILLLCGIALVYAGLRLFSVLPMFDVSASGKLVLIVATGWVTCGFWRSWRWIRDAVELARHTHCEYLFEAVMPLMDGSGEWLGYTRRLSTSQADVQWLGGIRHAAGIQAVCVAPGKALPLAITSVDAAGVAEISCAEDASYDYLRRALYSVDWHRQLRLAQWASEAHRQGLGGQWLPACIRHDDGRVSWAMLLRHEAGAKLVTAVEIKIGETLLIEHVFDNRLIANAYRAVAEIEPEVPMARGLINQRFSFFEIDTP